MIRQIIDSLKYAEEETENIEIAKGKYKLAVNFKSAIKEIKKLNKWQNKD
tara:strand:- start:225 stop:374 length:150 start_codon:yes stop_codon:yes gene_type:complete